MEPYLLIGLGNPGKKYELNRHNIGFMAVDAVADALGFAPAAKKFQGLIAEGTVARKKTFTLKPQTFMNLSGESVGAAARFYKIPTHHIFVIHDELDLPLGKVRVKRGGSSGGHNGLKSMDEHMGPDYWRVRLGISHPGDKERVTGHVLSDFSKEEIPVVGKLCTSIAKHIATLLNMDDAGFMNKITLDMKE